MSIPGWICSSSRCGLEFHQISLVLSKMPFLIIALADWQAKNNGIQFVKKFHTFLICSKFWRHSAWLGRKFIEWYERGLPEDEKSESSPSASGDEESVWLMYAKCKAERALWSRYWTDKEEFRVEPRVAAQDSHGSPVSLDHVYQKSEPTVGV